jgi:hypothetical protein
MRNSFIIGGRSTGLGALAALLVGCGGGTEPGNGVATIIVTPNPVSLPQLSITTLQVSPRDEQGDLVEGASVTFRSQDTTMVSVNSSGAIGALGPVGTTAITVASGTASVDVPVTVTLVQSMMIGTAKPIVFASDSTVPIEALVLDVFGYPVPGAQIEYSVEPASLFAITGTGVLSAASATATGFGTLTVRSGVLSASAPVAVASAAAHRQAITGGSPWGLGRTVDGGLFATGIAGPYLMIDPADATATALPLAGSEMVDVAPGATAASAWVVGAPAGSVSEIATATGEILGTVGGFAGIPRSIALSGDNARVFVGTDVGHLYVIDAATRAVSNTYPLQEAIWSLVVDAAGDKVYAAQPTRVSEFDLSEERVTRLFRPGGNTSSLVLHGTTLLIASSGWGVSVASLGSGAHTNHGLPCSAYDLALSPDGSRLAIACDTHYVVLADFPSMTLRALHPVGGYPRRVAFTADGQGVIATNLNGWIDFLDFP